MKKILKNSLALFIGIVIAFTIAEVVLRIYNPFPSRFRGDTIQLKTNVKKRIVIEPKIEGLDSSINYSINSLGFRGEEKLQNATYSIITVGGSTTECSLLDDKKTWTAKLGSKLKEKQPNIWINNAGLDGATTYGHNILLDDYILKLKPNMVIFLIGVNDRGKSDFTKEDGILINRKESIVKKLVKKSEVANLANNLYLMYKTHKVNLGHNTNVKYEKSQLDVVIKDSITLANIKKPHLNSLLEYNKRVNLLADKCISNNILPVFVTQPLIYGGEGWAIMEFYNKEVINICKEKSINYIDLANLLPKNTNYYYDEMHYTNNGAAAVADYIYQEIITIIQTK
jgi:lysophospholipase L1-like esterase